MLMRDAKDHSRMDTIDSQPGSRTHDTPASGIEPVFALTPGDRIGADYTVLEPLGAGSMGEVYRVRYFTCFMDLSLQ